MSSWFGRDGLPARDSGPWAHTKLDHLTRYAGIVTTSMKSKWVVKFVDLMAGPGRCIDTHTHGNPEFDGSTLRALDTSFPFARVIAVEANTTYADALRVRASERPRAATSLVIEGDCNDPAIVAQLRGELIGSLTLMFVDLLGTEVEMETLRSLTAGNRVDLVITWPVMDLNRNRGMMNDQPERWTAFFGTDAWLPIVRDLGPARRLVALQHLYVRQLGRLGYAHHRVLRGVTNRRGGVLYRQMFASKNPRGVEFWDKSTAGPARQNPQFDW